MSRNAVERALWQLSTDRSAKQKFKEDAAGFLKRFALTDEERDWILGFEVKAMQEAGVNPMLTMGFWQELGPKGGMRGYVQKLRGGEQEGAVHAAAIKGDK